MNNKILIVDDEPQVLKLIQRQIPEKFALSTAESGREALAVLKNEGPFAIIVSDMRMPGMNGTELLGRVKDLYPDTVRMMLTGYADQDTAKEAVNIGNVFRFLTKPCPSPELNASLELGQKQYQLITSEKELLKKTLKGSILVLSELLSISNPLAFSSSMRFKVYVTKIAAKLELPNLWQYEIAALMSHIGCVTLPKDVLAKVYYNHDLTNEEQKMYSKHPAVGAKLIEKIPRLENVTKIIAMQQRRFDEYNEEITNRESEEVILGAQIMKTLIDFDLHMFHGESRKKALELLQNDKGAHNPQIIQILDGIEVYYKEHIVALNVEELAIGMVFAEDVVASSGELITPRGQSITMSTKQFLKLVGIKEPIKVNIGLVERP